MRKRPVVAGALDVVVAAERISAGPGPHVISRDEKQVGNRRGTIRTHDVLRDAHRPEDADAAGVDDQVRDLLQQLDAEAGLFRRELERERLEALAIGG